MTSVIIPGNCALANGLTERACEQHKDVIFGYIYVNPSSVDEALRELERCSRLDCFRGVKIHPQVDMFYPQLEAWFPVYRAIEDLSLPVLWHSGTEPTTNPLQIAAVAREFPNVPHILGHFGLGDHGLDCFTAAKLSDNIYVDVSINPIIPWFNAWIEEIGSDRMLWGSDYPFCSMEYEAAKLAYLVGSDRDLENVHWRNSVRLFGLDEARLRASVPIPQEAEVAES
jgi:predicted TIM-barrel fold metal-dependent hydrolase